MDYTRMNLQLFAEGGAGAAGGAGSSGGQAAAPGMEAAAERSPFARGRRREQQPAEVHYGGQAQPQVAPAEQQMEAAVQEGTQEDFESLISGRYKQDFERRVQGILQDRLKNSRERESRVAPILEMVAEQYGMDASDMEKLDLAALAEKMAGDTSRYEAEAAEMGLPAEVLAKLRKLERVQRRNEREAAMRQKFEEQMRAQQQLQSHFQNLQKQAEEVKKVYPGFDLEAELKNKAFVEMTKPGSNVDVMTAFRAIHHDELAGAEMQYAARKSAERISASVAANARRPAENGIKGSSAATAKLDPANLSREDIRNLREEVLKGKKKVYLD
ncbi:MAG: hypothetical protein J6M10_03685 [Clostridia bacterium]|nr:hypothetical protein [Clostridia bacterium]